MRYQSLYIKVDYYFTNGDMIYPNGDGGFILLPSREIYGKYLSRKEMVEAFKERTLLGMRVSKSHQKFYSVRVYEKD